MPANTFSCTDAVYVQHNNHMGLLIAFPLVTKYLSDYLNSDTLIPITRQNKKLITAIDAVIRVKLKFKPKC